MLHHDDDDDDDADLLCKQPYPPLFHFTGILQFDATAAWMGIDIIVVKRQYFLIGMIKY